MGSSHTTRATPHTDLVTTSSPIGPITRDPRLLELSSTSQGSQLSFQRLTLPPLTGEPLVLSPPSRIRDSAAPAGLSLPLVLLKVHTGLLLRTSSPSLNSNLLTAQPVPLATATTDAVADGNTKPSVTSKTSTLRLRIAIHIPPKMEPAYTLRLRQLKSVLLATKMSPQTMSLR